ncbi:shikimate dehydrogenase family protein [Streptomyces sp. NPDC127190]|uniref:shikimate dehydrogenase family protein n=1 Tax=Streptomyces sp. NPDC127190 TaxID=3345387 RepID=UPI00363D603B
MPAGFPPITGRTALTLLLGDPVVQARSPELVNAELERRGLEARLMPLRVAADDLATVAAALRVTDTFRGAVVTMPHKHAVVPLLTTAGERVARTAACNVIRREEDGSLTGDMLDGEAMVRAIQDAGGTVKDARVLLVGAGGAASGIALALADHGVAELDITNRTAARADALADRVAAAVPGVRVTAVTAPGDGYALVVNASAVGMRPEDGPPVAPGVLTGAEVVADAVIAPRPTALLAAAAAAGCATVDGGRMLAAQVGLMVDFMFAGDMTPST